MKENEAIISIGRILGIGRGFVTLLPYWSSQMLDDDLGDVGSVTEARKFRVCR